MMDGSSVSVRTHSPHSAQRATQRAARKTRKQHFYFHFIINKQNTNKHKTVVSYFPPFPFFFFCVSRRCVLTGCESAMLKKSQYNKMYRGERALPRIQKKLDALPAHCVAADADAERGYVRKAKKCLRVGLWLGTHFKTFLLVNSCPTMTVHVPGL